MNHSSPIALTDDDLEIEIEVESIDPAELSAHERPTSPYGLIGGRKLESEMRLARYKRR